MTVIAQNISLNKVQKMHCVTINAEIVIRVLLSREDGFFILAKLRHINNL